jgi:hypothetical protein
MNVPKAKLKVKKCLRAELEHVERELWDHQSESG